MSPRIEPTTTVAVAAAVANSRRHEDDSMSIDWTLNIRRKCCHLFGNSYRRTKRAASLEGSHQLSQVKSQASDLIVRQTRRTTTTTHEDSTRGRKKRQTTDEEKATEDFIHSFRQIDFSSSSKGADNLSALSASSSLLSQLLNSSLNQLIEIDNGSDSELQQQRPTYKQVDERDLRLVRVASSGSSSSSTLTDGASSSNSSSSAGFGRPPALQKVRAKSAFVAFEISKRQRHRNGECRWRKSRDRFPATGNADENNNQRMSSDSDLNERFKNLRLNSESPPDGRKTRPQTSNTTTPSGQVFVPVPSSSTEAAAGAAEGDTQNDSLFAGATSRQLECGRDISDAATPQTTLINGRLSQRSQHAPQQQQQQQQQHDSLLETSSLGEEAAHGQPETEPLDQCDFQCCPVCEFQFAQLIQSAQAAAAAAATPATNNSRDQAAAAAAAATNLTAPNREGQRQIIIREDQRQVFRSLASSKASSNSSRSSPASCSGSSSSSSDCAVRVTTSSDSSEDSSDRLLKLKQHLISCSLVAAPPALFDASAATEMGLASSNNNHHQSQPQSQLAASQRQEGKNFLHRNHSDRSQHHQRNLQSCAANTETTLSNLEQAKAAAVKSTNLDWILDESPFIIKGQSNAATTQLLSVTKISPREDNGNDDGGSESGARHDERRPSQSPQRNSIQFSLDPRDLSVKRGGFVGVTASRDEDRSSMVEAKASLVRVVDIEDSSCLGSSSSTVRSARRRNRRLHNSSSSMMLMRGVLDEPIYDIPSASPMNIMRQAPTGVRCLSPDEKYPSERPTKTKVELSNDLVMIERQSALARSRLSAGKTGNNRCNCDKCLQFKVPQLRLSTRRASSSGQGAGNSNGATNDSLSRLAEHGSGRSFEAVRSCCRSSLSCSCSTCSSSSTLLYLASKRRQQQRRRQRARRKQKQRRDRSCLTGSCYCSCCSTSMTATVSADCSSSECSTAGSLTQEYLRRHQRSRRTRGGHRRKSAMRATANFGGRQKKAGRSGSHSHVESRLLRSARAEGAQILAGNGLLLRPGAPGGSTAAPAAEEDEQSLLMMGQEHAMQLAANGHSLGQQRVGGSHQSAADGLRLARDDTNGAINDLRLSALADDQSKSKRRRSRLLLMQRYERLSEERSGELDDNDAGQQVDSNAMPPSPPPIEEQNKHQTEGSNYGRKQGHSKPKRQRQSEMQKLTPESSCSCHASHHHHFHNGRRFARRRLTTTRSRAALSGNRKTGITHSHHRHHYHHRHNHSRHHHQHHSGNSGHRNRRRRHRSHHHNHHHQQQQQQQQQHSRRRRHGPNASALQRNSRHLCHLADLCRAATNSHGRNSIQVAGSATAAAVEASRLLEAAAEQRQKARLIRRLLRRQQELDALETQFKQLKLGAAKLKTGREEQPLVAERMRPARRLKVGAGSQLSGGSGASVISSGRRRWVLGRGRHFLKRQQATKLGPAKRLLLASRQRAKAVQTDQQQHESGSLSMNRFLVRRNLGGQEMEKNEKNDGDLFRGWQLTERCQCSHCCLVEKFILMDAHRKQQRKLARKLYWRKQCDAAILAGQPNQTRPTSRPTDDDEHVEHDH